MRTCVVTMARLEGRYLPEFIEHYKSLGFTNIIFCDNNHSDDNEDVKGILKPYSDFVIYEGYVDKVGYQMRCYTEIYEKYKNDYDWFFFCDIDEHLYLENHKTIDEFLQDKQDFDCVLINWLCYGDCEQIEADYTKPLKERFTYPLPLNLCVQYQFPENAHIKSIVKGGINVVFYGNPHIPSTPLRCCNANGVQVDNRPWQNIDYTNAHIKHYVTKSLEEWCTNKMARGTADRDYQTFIKFYSNRYFQYNKPTQEKLDWLKNHNFIKT